MEKSLNRYIKLFPWYSGITGDLLFYIAIDTLFLTIVKNFSSAEIVSITSLSRVACIVLQFPILFIIRKIGNTASVRLGALSLLISAVFITFGKSYYLVLIGRIFHDIAVILRTASIVALENNLELLGKRGEFVHIRTSANTVYAVITMIISFVASFLFNLNNYLPMICCIATCTVGVVLSLFMKDCSSYNKIANKAKAKEKTKVHYSKFIILTVIIYAVFYSLINHGQGEGKLFIQENVLLDFDVEKTALIIGAVICISRIIRVISNIIFEKLYKKYQSQMGVILPSFLVTSMGLILFGSFISVFIVKITVMTVGYAILLFIRDPFKLYIQDVVFEATPKEQHQTLLTLLEFGVKIAAAGVGLGFSAILTVYPLIVVVSIMFALSIIEIILSLKLYREILVGKKQRQVQGE